MKLVSQNYDLMPYLTVAENIGKFISNTNLSEKKQKIQELLQSSWTRKLRACFAKKFEWWSATARCDCESAFCNAETTFIR